MTTRFWCGLLAVLCAASLRAGAQDFDSLVPGASATGSAPRTPAASRQAAQPATPSSPQPAAPRAPRRATPAPPPDPIRVERPPAGGSAPVTITASVDRAAAWIGEPVIYTIDIVCPPGTDILADDLSRDRLHPSGLEVVDASQTRTVDDEGTIRYRNRFTLVSYTLGGAPARLQPQSVRYYVHTAGQPTDTLVPADEIAIAPVTVAIRSALPDAGVTWIRDVRPIVMMSSGFDYLLPVGLTLGSISLLPLAWSVTGLVRLRLPKRTARIVKSATSYRDRIEDARRQGSTGDGAARQSAFATLSDVIRERLTDVGVPAHGLTPDELTTVIADKAPALAALDLVSILRVCERALYGGLDHLPPASDVPATADIAEQLLMARAR